VDGTVVATSGPFEIPITRGWNLFGPPWPGPLDWADARVSVNDGSTTLPLGQAVASGWLAGSVFDYQPGTGTYALIQPNNPADGPLAAWRGYVVFSNVDGRLVIAPPPPDTTAPTVALTSPTEDAELTGAVT